MLVSWIDEKASLWDPFTEQKLHVAYHVHPICSVAFNSDGAAILIGCYSDNTAYLWSTVTGELLQEFSHSETLFNIISVACSPTNNTFLTASSDGTLCLWDQRGQQLNTFKDIKAFTVTFSPNGKMFLAGTKKETLLMETKTGKLIQKLNGPSTRIVSALFSHDGRTILTHFQDTVSVWDTQTGTILTSFNDHKHGVSSLAWGPHENTLFIGSDDGTVSLYTRSSKADNWINKRKDTARDLFLALKFSKELLLKKENSSLVGYLREKSGDLQYLIQKSCAEQVVYDSISMCNVQ